MAFSKIINPIVDLIWPKTCLACGARLPHADVQATFCHVCHESLMPVLSPYCPRCALPFEGVGPDHLCKACLLDPPAFSEARALYHYGEAAAKAVLRLKYAPMPQLARPLGKLLVEVVRAQPAPDVIVPVPLHKKRLRQRGFNQAVLIAQPISRELGRPLVTRALARIRQTRAQAGLSATQRKENLNGAFEVREQKWILDRKVLIIDDVITTGTTLREVSSVLKAAGAADVAVAAVARAC